MVLKMAYAETHSEIQCEIKFIIPLYSWKVTNSVFFFLISERHTRTTFDLIDEPRLYTHAKNIFKHVMSGFNGHSSILTRLKNILRNCGRQQQFCSTLRKYFIPHLIHLLHSTLRRERYRRTLYVCHVIQNY